MKSTVWLLTCILVVILAGSAGAGQGPGNPNDPDEWTVPDCDRVAGTNTVTFTTDGGLTLAETSRLMGTVYNYGLVALDVPNTLLASSLTSAGTTIMRSEDAGCKWEQVALLPIYELLELEAGPGDVAYGWSHGRIVFYRIEGDEFVALAAPAYVYGLAVDPADAQHIRIGTPGCRIYESFDGGATFAPLGGPAYTVSTVLFTVEFDPNNMDCALCGTKGAYRTTDAGQSWSRIVPFDYEDVDLVYLFDFSPADPNRVWARASLETVTNYSREIMVSHDGGATFGPAFAQGDEAVDQFGNVQEVLLTNQPTMAAHPDQPDIFYLAFGASFQNYGSNIFRYDLRLDELSVAHIDGLDGIDAIAFNPADADVMYLGLESEMVRAAKADAGSGESMKVSVSPNPFNPVANINFNLPNAAQVRLEVFNIVGQKVSTLVNDYLNAGDHHATWDGVNFSSGVYLYRLQVGETVYSDKMLLLK